MSWSHHCLVLCFVGAVGRVISSELTSRPAVRPALFPQPFVLSLVLCGACRACKPKEASLTFYSCTSPLKDILPFWHLYPAFCK